MLRTLVGMGKLVSQLINTRKNIFFFFLFLPFKFLDCLRQHNNCSLLVCTVAFFLFVFELFPYTKGEGGM